MAGLLSYIGGIDPMPGNEFPCNIYVDGKGCCRYETLIKSPGRSIRAGLLMMPHNMHWPSGTWLLPVPREFKAPGSHDGKCSKNHTRSTDFILIIQDTRNRATMETMAVLP